MVSCLEILKKFEKGASKKEFERHPSFIVIGPTSENVGRWKTSLPVAVIQISRGGGGYLGQVLLGMCRCPLRTPTPLQSILWPAIDPILVTFGQMPLWLCESTVN